VLAMMSIVRRDVCRCALYYVVPSAQSNAP
jgi:hypothetical protein